MAAFHDVRNSTDDLYDSTRIVNFSGGDNSVGGSVDGWYPEGNGFYLKAGSTEVLLVDLLDEQVETTVKSLKPDVLIVGRSIVRSEELYTRLQKGGLSQLVVAGVRQSKALDSPDEPDSPIRVGEDFIFDLSWLGSVTVQLSGNP
jgi:hypothetical protein